MASVSEITLKRMCADAVVRQASRLWEDKIAFKAFFQPLVCDLFRRMQQITVMNRAYRMPLMTLLCLSEIRFGEGTSAVHPFAELIAEQDNFDPEQTVTSDYGLVCYLDSFFTISQQVEDGTQFFHPLSRERPCMECLVTESLRNELEFVRATMFRVMHSLLLNHSTRAKVVKYLCGVLHRFASNISFDSETCGRILDCSVVNLLCVLQLLSSQVQLKQIDPYFPFRSNALLNFNSGPRIRFSPDCMEALIQDIDATKTVLREFEYPTIIWFLTLQAHHDLLLPLIRTYQRYRRQSSELTKALDQMSRFGKSDQDKSDPACTEGVVHLRTQELKNLNAKMFHLAAIILHDDLLKKSLFFYATMVDYLISITVPKNQFGWLLLFPLPAEVPTLFANSPQWFIEDMVDFLLFILQCSAETATHNLCDKVITFFLAMLCSSNYISNPLLQAKMVDVLFVIDPQVRNGVTNIIHGRIMHNLLAKTELPSALMNIYADVETVWSGAEANDRITLKSHIRTILKTMWMNSGQRNTIIQRSCTNPFVRFIEVLMIDTSDLLEKCLQTLKFSREMQVKLSNQADESCEEQRCLVELLQNHRGQFWPYPKLVTQAVELLRYFTEEIKEPFQRHGILRRLVAILNHCLMSLYGPDSKNMDIRALKSYGWDPAAFLFNCVNIYLHLDSDILPEVLAEDQLLFSQELFEEVANRVERNFPETASEISQFRSLGVRAQVIIAHRRIKNNERKTAEEYRDPLINTSREKTISTARNYEANVAILSPLKSKDSPGELTLESQDPSGGSFSDVATESDHTGYEASEDYHRDTSAATENGPKVKQRNGGAMRFNARKSNRLVKQIGGTPKSTKSTKAATSTNRNKCGVFVCDTCKAVYGRQDSLVRHQKKHQIARDHICGVCGSTFMRADVLKVHIQDHHKSKNQPRLPCGFDGCTVTFQHESSRKKHVRNKHSSK